MHLTLDSLFGGSFGSTPKLRHVSDLWRNNFKLDMAFCAVIRQETFQERRSRFGLADSSPQGPYDFLLWKYHWVLWKNLIRAADAVALLATTKGGAWCEDTSEDEHEVDLVIKRSRADANRTLASTVHQHLCAPIYYYYYDYGIFVICFMNTIMGFHDFARYP